MINYSSGEDDPRIMLTAPATDDDAHWARLPAHPDRNQPCRAICNAMKPEFRMIETNGVKLRAAVQGEGPLVVMVHGFPESWYSWRHQIAPLAAAGFTACAIDVRGYGGSDKPHAVEAYAMKELAADVAGVIDALSPGAPAVLIGHDWGAPIVWHTAVLHPDESARRRWALGAVLRPAAGAAEPDHQGDVHRSGQVFLHGRTFRTRASLKRRSKRMCAARCASSIMRRQRRLGGLLGHARQEGTASRLLAGLDDPDPFPAWLTPADIDYFVSEFERSRLPRADQSLSQFRARLGAT